MKFAADLQRILLKQGFLPPVPGCSIRVVALPPLPVDSQLPHLKTARSGFRFGL